jgi:predicted anti-sigma-YlaC factor YlaD
MSDETRTLSCRDTTYLVVSSRDMPLTPAEQGQLAAHLAGCSACRTANAQFAALFAQLDILLARREP